MPRKIEKRGKMKERLAERQRKGSEGRERRGKHEEEEIRERYKRDEGQWEGGNSK